MSAELALVDTNVLVYAFHRESEHHAACRALLDQAQNGQIALCITSQVLAEFYAIVTDRRRVGVPRQPEETLRAIAAILAMPGVTVLPVPADVVTRWTALVQQHPVTGGAVFDAQLAATMLGNGIARMYTFDRSHFERYEELEVLTPQPVD